jgi:hypothetical protein
VAHYQPCKRLTNTSPPSNTPGGVGWFAVRLQAPSHESLQPVVAPPVGASTCSCARAFLPNEVSADNRIQYVVPGNATSGKHRILIESSDSFEAYRTAIQKTLKSKLPPALADHHVIMAFVDLLTVPSAEAQLAAQAASKKLNAEMVHA